MRYRTVLSFELAGESEGEILMKKITALLAAALVLCFASVSFADTTRTCVDWNGFYLSAKSGKITALYLGNNDTFILSKHSIKTGKNTFAASGKIKWSADGSSVTFGTSDKKWKAFVGEGYAELTEIGAKRGKALKLDKADEFTDGRSRLVVLPGSVIRKEVSGAPHVMFTGMINFAERLQGGHRSLVATFDLDCSKNMVDMPTIAYYYGTYARGKILDSSINNKGNWLPFSGADVAAQAANAYCIK